MIEPSQQMLQGLLAATPDALLAVDEAGAIVFVNDRAGHLFGWTAAELVGAPIEMLVPEAVAAAHVGHRARYIEDPVARPMGSGLRLFARCKDGSTFPAEISLGSVADESGRRLVLAAVRDVTERTRSDLAMREREAPSTVFAEAATRAEAL
ncbi:MAG: PAS domain S-box protein, partial [Acidimicrobiales bacterium]